jgi:alpha-galactosidase/6-phospho-beta-glucosidase family protein
MWSILSGETYTRVVNVLNSGGFIPGLPKDACVEVKATMAGRSMTAETAALPTAALSWVQRWTAIHDLTIRAACHHDRAAAAQALMLDPHVTDLYDIEPMLDDFLATLEPWMPREWYKR